MKPKILLRRGTSTYFDEQVGDGGGVDLALKGSHVALLTDTGQLAFFDPTVPNHWSKIDGVFLKEDLDDEFLVGELVSSTNVIIKATKGLYTFPGYRVSVQHVASFDYPLTTLHHDSPTQGNGQ